MAEIEGLVRALRVGDDAAKAAAVRAVRDFPGYYYTNRVLIAEAGGIPPLVELLRDGSADAKAVAALALGNLARDNGNKVLIAEAGGIAPLVQLLRDGSADAWAESALWVLSRNNDANAVAIAAVGFEALVELARRGRVTVNNRSIVENAALPAKRKAALVVAALLRACVPDSVPREIKGLIGPYI